MHPVEISTARLRLREITAADAGAILAVYGDPQVTEHLSFEPRTPEQVSDIVDRFRAWAQAEPRIEYVLAVTMRDNDELIGVARLATDPHQPRAATMGFALRADTWGHGLGVETVEVILTLAFDHLDLHRVWAARSPANTASARTMLKVGMVEEGRIREHVEKAGKWRDSIVHSLLDHEWRSRTRPGGDPSPPPARRD